MNICALIAVHNEADVILDVVTGARRHVSEVVVVDDGSSDGSRGQAIKAGATCIGLDHRRGKGAALRAGLARVMTGDHTHVLFLDGDGQHATEDIPALVRLARDTGADLVIGTRSLNRAGMPWTRHLSNTVGSWLASRLVGCPVRDSQSGFRLVRLDRLRGLPLCSKRYEFEMEVLIKLRQRGATIAEAPVQMVYNGGRARSKMHPVRDTVRICFWSLAFWLSWR